MGYVPPQGVVFGWAERRQLKLRRISDSILLFTKDVPRVTTTSTSYVEFDDNGLGLFAWPFLQSSKTKIYCSCFILGVDLGVQLVYVDSRRTTVLEEREWSGSKYTLFFFHDITDRVFASHWVHVKLQIKTTATSGTLSRGSKIMVVVDRGEW